VNEETQRIDRCGIQAAMAPRNLRRLSLLAFAAAAVLTFAVACTALAAGTIAAVGAIGMTVSDADRSAAFFTDVLGFEKISDVEVAGESYERLQGVFPLRMRVVRLRLGSETIELTQYLTPRGLPMPPDTRANDRWFQHIAIVVSDMARAYEHLRKHRVEHASSGPQLLPQTIPAAAGIEAFYFRDPDGHFLEILAFPAGKGDERWQRQEPLFLGIDHTAIVISDTAASLAFYRDVLGLRVAGESENFGTEQEHLNGVFGARLRITALRAAQGPGIELLEYISPSTGRPRPAGAAANDLLHWQVDLVPTDLDAAAIELNRSRAPMDSPGIVAADGALGFTRAALAADPDGHRLRFVETRDSATSEAISGKAGHASRTRH